MFEDVVEPLLRHEVERGLYIAGKSHLLEPRRVEYRRRYCAAHPSPFGGSDARGEGPACQMPEGEAPPPYSAWCGRCRPPAAPGAGGGRPAPERLTPAARPVDPASVRCVAGPSTEIPHRAQLVAQSADLRPADHIPPPDRRSGFRRHVRVEAPSTPALGPECSGPGALRPVP